MSFCRAILCILPLLLAGCAHSLTDKGLSQVDKSISFHEIRKNPDAFIGKTVLVGGVVAAVYTTAEGGVLEVAQFDLAEDKAPNTVVPSGGAFLATSADFATTAPVGEGRVLTMIGEVKGKKVQTQDKTSTIFPVIAIRELHLWNTLEPDRYPPLPGHYEPYYSGYPTDQYMERPIGPSYKRY